MSPARRLASKIFRFGIVPKAKERAGRAYMDVRARRDGPRPEIRETTQDSNRVDEYWTGHTVNSTPFLTARQSSRYLDWRFREYPLFREFSGLYGVHEGQAVLDY